MNEPKHERQREGNNTTENRNEIYTERKGEITNEMDRETRGYKQTQRNKQTRNT